ncbi:hypothetical protein [Rhodalgimonas zhirmunskyi]|uniref:Uncharacterized protein n=1 Tax=Rhodalgimonas zhirmunskyi TaxID=2964767 RepID=A0AAJ1X557_9RHOB|nr:hypothetical protein [Rhodoalgimonas zhirmunskyi]MDQ2093829.1 hypothetical protein [Rhodoalgimonas zhirmunskyi]
MSGFEIPPQSRPGVWVFHVDLPEHALDAFKTAQTDEATGRHHWPLAEALGLNWLDPEHIELFDANMMKEYGLSRYLSDANGMDLSTMNPAGAPIDRLSGTVLLLFSKALPEDATYITPRAPLEFVAHLEADQPAPDLTPLPSATALGHVEPGGRADAGAGPGRGWILPLVFLAGAVLATLIFLVVS